MNKNTTLSIAISLALLGGTVTSIEAYAAGKDDKQTSAKKDTTTTSKKDTTVKAEKPAKKETETTTTTNPAKKDTTIKAEKPAKKETVPTTTTKPAKKDTTVKAEKPAKKDDDKVSKKPSKLDKPPKNSKKLADLGIDSGELSELGSFDVSNISEDAIGEFEAENFEALSEEGAGGLSKKQMKKADKKALKGLKGKHIDAMPPETFEGMTAENLGGLEGDAIQALDPDQLEAIPDEAIDELSEEEAAGMLANLGEEILVEGEEIEGDTSAKAKKIKRFLPPGWLIGKGNMLKRPPAAIIMMPVLVLPMHSSAALKMELAIANLNAGFGLGGATGEDGTTALDGMNQLLDGTGYEIEQTEEGILAVENPEDGGELAFTPDADGMVQGPEDAEPGLGLNEEGQYILTLEGGEQLPIDPAPKSFAELADNPDIATVEIGEESEVTMEVEGDDAEDSSVIVGVFDPLVTDAPAGTEPGVYIEGTPGEDEQAVIVYEDGSQQVVNPAVQEPGEFEDVADDLAGVDDVTVNADGSITVVLDGGGADMDGDGDADDLAINLTPALEIETNDDSTEETTEEEITPTIDINDDGTVTYTDSDGDVQDLYIGESTVVDDVEDDSSDTNDSEDDTSTDTTETDDSEDDTSTDTAETDSSEDATSTDATETDGSEDNTSTDATETDDSEDATSTDATETDSSEDTTDSTDTTV